MCVSLSDCQTVETMGPKDMGISPGILSWEKKGAIRGWACFLGRDFTLFYHLSDTIQNETEAQAVMGQCWVGPHLEQDCLDVRILGSLFDFDLMLGPSQMDLSGYWISLSFFSCFPLLIWLFIGSLRTSGWTWFGAQIVIPKSNNTAIPEHSLADPYKMDTGMQHNLAT